jgi:uncharacterized membrane protein/predicted DsbA family dithiol-disulfide isomerase
MKQPMLRRYRYALIGLALLGLATSVTALVVHYRLMTDPAYASFCDINETVSCQQVLQSSYATLAGVPIAAGGAIWSLAVLLLAFWGMRHTSSELAGRVAGYIFVLATVGLAAVFYYGYASFFVLGTACPLCMAMYASVAGIFLASAAAATSLTSIPARLGEDVRSLTRSQTATTLTVAWLAASIALVILFPRQEAFGAQAPAVVDAIPEPELEALTPEQLAEWNKYLDSQTPLSEPGLLPTAPMKVRFVKFNDYQCPSCRQTWALYRGIIAKYEKEYPGVFVFETRDLPLEPECGLASNHTMACEAAAAVRLARTKDKAQEMETWLFNNQSFEMTRDDVKRGLREVAQITDFDEQYQKVLPAVREDVQLGQKLGVTGTPTFYMNGVKLGNVRPTYLDATIQYFLRKSGAAS